jgi:hypothetical protein
MKNYSVKKLCGTNFTIFLKNQRKLNQEKTEKQNSCKKALLSPFYISLILVLYISPILVLY